jgi:hypothetical protein
VWSNIPGAIGWNALTGAAFGHFLQFLYSINKRGKTHTAKIQAAATPADCHTSPKQHLPARVGFHVTRHGLPHPPTPAPRALSRPLPASVPQQSHRHTEDGHFPRDRAQVPRTREQRIHASRMRVSAAVWRRKTTALGSTPQSPSVKNHNKQPICA